jgi:glycerophosphoryl diester phosphodiesterase
VELPTSPNPDIDFAAIELRTNALSGNARAAMSGVYKVIQGTESFGDEVAGLWVGKRWCFYSKHDVVYSEQAGGAKGDSIILRGYSRIVRYGKAFTVDLSILPDDGGTELTAGTIPSNIVLRGSTSNGGKIVLQRVRALYAANRPLHILAHRGGGRNSERLGYSENSIEMLIQSQMLGATGVEIDIKHTRDGQLIVFHDDTFSPRTIKGAYLLGDVEDYDLNQIKVFGKLIYGESIPTVAEALRAAIDNTGLSLVWLDLKDPGFMDEAIRIQKEAIDYAALQGRTDIQILLGIPGRDMLNAYRSSSLKNTTPIIIELDVDDVLSPSNPTCQGWAPRWTNGIPRDDIARVHASGKKVFVWTLDVRDYIEDFLYDSEVDGILSNYPSLIAGMHYTR